jgi:hypothetical protein
MSIKLGEAGLVFEDGGDVVEEDAGLGEVGDGADERLEGLHIDGSGIFGHSFRSSSLG